MKKFIDEIVELYLNECPDDALKNCIITPNKRAHRFIKHTILEEVDGGGFLPSIFSIDEFIFKHIPLIRIDEVDLSYILFDVFIESRADEPIDFDEFLSYSSILLKDFNEIDMQLANGRDIFSYLNDAKAIQQWNPDGSPLSPSQKEYLAFYNHLAEIYTKFREALFTKGLCYQGMAYRYFAENVNNIIEELPWKNILFAGFNALTKSEEKIIKFFAKKEMVKTLWDADHYYLNNKIMEAGMYLRKYKNWDKEIEKQAKKNFLTSQKNIEITGVPGILAQVRLTSQWIQEQTSSFENNTVIVPADESLLLPLLNSLPAKTLKNTNITMGFPINHSHAYRLAESIIRLHIHSSKISSLNSAISRYHKDDLLSVLNNELFKVYKFKIPEIRNDYLPTFIGEERLKEYILELGLQKMMTLFESCKNQPIQIVEKLRLVFKEILNHSQEDVDGIINPEEKDALEQILTLFNRLSILITEKQKPDTLQGFYKLYKQLIQNLSQSFTGDYNKGLQLMGLLETRLMDFENVMILSANEDILPTSSFSNSFIPSDIRYEFDLPGIQERTAVFAYHFYRLIQRAKNVYLVYSTTKKKMSGGEKSRFIKQLEFELREYYKDNNVKTSINHQLLNFEKLNILKASEITINKDKAILNRLNILAKKGLSPTALISYVRCPLQFYYKYIVKVYEPEQAEDQIDERIIGNVIHKILEDFYRPFIKKDFPYKELIRLKKNIPQLIAKTFKSEFNGKTDEGHNYLSVKDTEHYLNKFVDYEIEAAKHENNKLTILGVEENLKRTITIDGQEILIKGNADRIDEKNNIIRILDYKTGNVDKTKVKIPKNKEGELNEIFTDNKYEKALQLFVYHWLFRAHSSANAQAGIVSFKLIKSPYIMLNQEITDDIDSDFNEFISSIFNLEIPFKQTDDIKNCGYCIYKGICSVH